MRPTVWREARRANRDEGLGTSMPGRILGVLGFLVLIWAMLLGDADGNGFDAGDIVMGVVITVAGLGLLGAGLTEDYRDAVRRLTERNGP